jgi:PAS domain S-box-containing protein
VAIHSDGKIVHLNSPGAELLGAARVEELIGMPILNFIHPDSLEMVQWRVQQIEAGNGVPLLEEKFVRLDGSSVDVEVASVPITYQGRPAVQTVIRDITPRKRAEAEREYLLATEREQRLLAETLGEVFLALTAQTSHETVLDEILRQIQRLVSHSAANIVLLKNKTLQIARYQGYQAFSSNALVLSLEQSLSDFPLDAEVVNSRRPLVIPDTHQNPRWVTAPESAWIRSFLVVPICLGDRVLGLLRLDSDTPGQFSTQDAKRLEPLANAAAIALENARLYDQARQEIVERVQAERELRQIATKNQAILNAIPDSMFHLSRDGRLLDYKIYDAASPQKMLSEIGIKSLRNTLHLWPDLVDLTLQHIARTLDTGEIQIFECQLPLPSGPRDYEARLVVNGADEVLAIVRDITERKARNAALEKERARIARDLHDSLGQSLGYLHLKLDELTSTNLLPELEPIRPQLIQMRNVANEAYELVRNMLAAARPANSTDLATALLAQAKSAGNRAGFRINLTSEGQPRPLSPIAQHQILYMFQEALSNVVKHAKAQHVDLKLVWAEDMLTISLADDGCGFDTSTLQTDGHFGLTIMQERAEEINGFLSINSSPNAGAELTLRLPLTPMSQPLVLENLAF